MNPLSSVLVEFSGDNGRVLTQGTLGGDKCVCFQPLWVQIRDRESLQHGGNVIIATGNTHTQVKLVRFGEKERAIKLVQPGMIAVRKILF